MAEDRQGQDKPYRNWGAEIDGLRNQIADLKKQNDELKGRLLPSLKKNSRLIASFARIPVASWTGEIVQCLTRLENGIPAEFVRDGVEISSILESAKGDRKWLKQELSILLA